MAQATNPKIEELRARIKSDPKSRLFFPLAEELRKMGALVEAEEALRAGLEQHPTYLSAWVSLGRVLRERGNSSGVVEVLTKALQLDPGNVVAARILADTYLDTGQKIEAIKKYKLVHALLPQDQDVEALIDKLDAELNPAPAAPPAPPPSPTPAPVVDETPSPTRESRDEAVAAPPPFGAAPAFATEDAFPGFTMPSSFPGETAPETGENLAASDAAPRESAPDLAARDEPASVSHPEEEIIPALEQETEPLPADEASFFEDQPSAGESALSRPSQFDDTAPLGYDTYAFAVEQPLGMHISGPEESASDDPTLVGPAAADRLPFPDAPPPATADAPPAEPSRDLFRSDDVPSPWSEPAAAPREAYEPAERSDDGSFGGRFGEPFDAVPESPDLSPLHEEERPAAALPPSEHLADDVTNTITMGDLYARQGLVDDAREIYSRVLERDPGNESVRAKLDHLQQAPSPVPTSNANAKAARLEAWLSRVKRGSGGV
jgi:tetratricopeptide (TPR) repeat protein